MKFKKLCPVVNCTFITNHSVAHMLTILKKNIDTKQEVRKPALFSKPAKPFSGKMDKDQFTITRIVSYNQTFVPIISGNVLSKNNKTVVEVTMRLQSPVAAFIRFWIIAVVILCTASIVFLCYNGVYEVRDLTPFLLLFVGSLAFFLPFKFEVTKAKKILAELLNAKNAKERG
ncbi:MAG TPA: hypothetical protein VFF27_13580 [Bacteroidia bacterium]|jgi:hypothetical protein|nr:hypothetical protein [Bacteroidia bacterium]